MTAVNPSRTSSPEITGSLSFKKLFALALVLIMAIGLVACGFAPKPELDLEDAAENFEDEKYVVDYVDDEDYLAPGQTEKLYVYTDDYDDELTVIVFEKASTAKLYYKDHKLDMDIEYKELKAQLKFNEHMLKHFEDDMDSDEVDELEDEIKELEKELEDYKENYVIGRKGNVVWYGTKSAVEDSKG